MTPVLPSTPKETEAREARRLSEEHFRAFVFAQPDPIHVLANDGTILVCNEAAAGAHGLTAAEMAGRSAFAGIPAEAAAERRAVFERVLATRQAVQYVEKIRERSYEARMAPICDARGDVVKVAVCLHDITGRKRDGETLRESEEKFSKIFFQAPLLITLSEIESGRLIDVNQAFLDVSGFTREEAVGSTVLELGWITGEQRSRILLSLREGGRVAGLELSLRGKEGREITCLYSGEPITVNGKQRLLTVAQDITERKRAEDRLQRSEQFIRSILDTVDEGFIVIDRDFCILTVNKAYCNQVGGTSDDIVGRHCYEISHRAPRPCYEAGEECAVREVFATGEPHTASHRHIDAQGTVLFVETKAYPIRDISGAVTSVIETVNNITEKHLLEEERLKTQKLEAIGTLAGGIAHDFNNLLQGVFGYISMAKLKLDPREPSFDMLAQAEQALHLSVNLTTQLLTFSKGGQPSKKRLALQPLIENSVKFALSGSSVDYRIALAGDLMTVEADEGQISQVIQNIVLNADQSMPLGGTVEICAKNVRAPGRGLPPLLGAGNYVALSIRDSGVGIPEQYLQKIFDPYFTTKEKGSGLGLATSYSIVKNHGGLIGVASEAGRGTTFTVYLPAIESKKEVPPAVAAARVARKGNVLVMDDEEVVRTIAGEMIKALGHAVDFAKNGEEAIAKYRGARESGLPFDIVILDLTVRGGLGGKETLERLRSIDPGVKAVVSSGYSDGVIMAEHQAYGFRSCLAKPYKLETLRTTLNALLS